MKYNIIINQAVLSKSNVDLLDCAILDYIYWICSSPNAKITKNRLTNEMGTWTRLNYQQLLRELPLLRIKTAGALSPRIKRLEEAGYIAIFRPLNQKLYVRLTKQIDELFTKLNSYTRQNIAVHETKQLSPQVINKLSTGYPQGKTAKINSKSELSTEKGVTNNNNRVILRSITAKTQKLFTKLNSSEATLLEDQKASSFSSNKKVITHFYEQVQKQHKYKPEISKKDASNVQRLLSRTNDPYTWQELAKIIDWYIMTPKYKEFPTLSACLSAHSLSVYKEKNKKSWQEK